MARVQVGPSASVISIVDPISLGDEDEEPVGYDPETGVPAKLLAYVVSEDPKITVFPDFMSPVECDELLQLAEGNWIPSLVGAIDKVREDGPVKNARSRTRISSC